VIKNFIIKSYIGSMMEAELGKQQDSVRQSTVKNYGEMMAHASSLAMMT